MHIKLTKQWTLHFEKFRIYPWWCWGAEGWDIGFLFFNLHQEIK